MTFDFFVINHGFLIQKRNSETSHHTSHMQNAEFLGKHIRCTIDGNEKPNTIRVSNFKLIVLK